MITGLACLLALNALRVSKACGADLADLALANDHRVPRIVGEGNLPALVPLARRTTRAIDAAIGERIDGPLLARVDGSRLDRSLADGSCARCSLRDVQDSAHHADPLQTRRYDRARGALDRNPASIVATYLAGATDVL